MAPSLLSSRCALLFSFISAIVSSAFVIYGFYLRSTFHNGSECDMTWSVPGFRPLDLPKVTSTSSASNPSTTPSFASSPSSYRLLKFFDRRDPEYNLYGETLQHSSQKKDETVGSEWCPRRSQHTSSPDHAILYIPGHKGKYLQARSIGAHGTQLTRKSMSRLSSSDVYSGIANGTLHGHAPMLDDFVYTVFTIDFQEEGAGFHASLLYSQAEFISHCVQLLRDECGTASDGYDAPIIQDITIVAHSTGGIVARKALTLLADKGLVGKNHISSDEGFVKHLITLASPHVFFPFVLETTVHSFYETLVEDERRIVSTHNGNLIPVVSISGGLRDELIPPSSCEMKDEFASSDETFQHHSIFATDIMRDREETTSDDTKPTFGMDHKAITWCHNLLSVVREMIHMMISMDSSSSTLSTRSDMNKQIKRFLNNHMMENLSLHLDKNGIVEDYFDTYIGEKKLRKVYGYWASLAIESTQLYNTQLFTLLYALTGVLHHLSSFLQAKAHQYSSYNAYAFGLIPIASTVAVFLSVNETSIFYQKNTIVVVALASLARSLYFIIFALASPVSFVREKISLSLAQETGVRFDQKVVGKGSTNTSIAFGVAWSILQTRVRWFLFLLFQYILVLGTFNHFGYFDGYTMAWNMASLSSHCFIALVIFIFISILELGTRFTSCDAGICSGWERKERQLHRMTAVTLLPIFPVMVIGKLAYAWTLLSVEGQDKCTPFIKAEEDLWESKCQQANGFNFVCTMSIFMKHDLAFTTMCVCIPSLTVIMYVRWRYLAKYMSYRIRDSKQL